MEACMRHWKLKTAKTTNCKLETAMDSIKQLSTGQHKNNCPYIGLYKGFCLKTADYDSLLILDSRTV